MGSKAQAYKPLGDEETFSQYPLLESRRDSGPAWKKAFYSLLMLYTLALAFITSQNRTPNTDPRISQTIFPEFARTLVTFAQNHSFFPSNLTIQAQRWADLQPKGKGFISFTNPSAYNLSNGVPGKSNPEESGFCISMFHQLHCLDSLRSHLFSSPSSNSKHGFTSIGEEMAHLEHCIDYLRQAIMCAGDTTLESSRLDREGKATDGVNGWGIVHSCRSFESIKGFAEERGFLIGGDD